MLLRLLLIFLIFEYKIYNPLVTKKLSAFHLLHHIFIIISLDGFSLYLSPFIPCFSFYFFSLVCLCVVNENGCVVALFAKRLRSNSLSSIVGYCFFIANSVSSFQFVSFSIVLQRNKVTIVPFNRLKVAIVVV